jgi:hypothetical protein
VLLKNKIEKEPNCLLHSVRILIFYGYKTLILDKIGVMDPMCLRTDGDHWTVSYHDVAFLKHISVAK